MTKQAEDEAWAAATAAYLSDDSRDPDERWGHALDLLCQSNNATGVVVMLAAGAEVPDWVREELNRWRRGERPLCPSGVTADNERLLAAVRAYRAEPYFRDEKRQARLERIAQQHGVNLDSLDDFLNCRGGTYGRLVKDWKKWQRIYAPGDQS
jgi:hypothetical protein